MKDHKMMTNENDVSWFKFYDTTYPDVGPEQLLDIWKGIIMNEFELNNPEVSSECKLL
jgi:hypothetical protein